MQRMQRRQPDGAEGGGRSRAVPRWVVPHPRPSLRLRHYYVHLFSFASDAFSFIMPAVWRLMPSLLPRCGGELRLRAAATLRVLAVARSRSQCSMREGNFSCRLVLALSPRSHAVWGPSG